MSVHFTATRMGRGFAGGLPCQAPSEGSQPFASSPFAHPIPRSRRRASGDLFSGSLGPVNTYFAARDGDGFHPARGTSRAAEQAFVSGEQRRAGRNPSRPCGLRAKNTGAALQSLAIAGYALRFTPCLRIFYAATRVRNKC